jgi:hypothetical protein
MPSTRTIVTLLLRCCLQHPLSPAFVSCTLRLSKFLTEPKTRDRPFSLHPTTASRLASTFPTAMSFGFGVGDFIAVGTLAIQAYTSLQDSTGSAADYMSLKLIRGSFGKALAEAERQITNTSAGPPSKFAADIKKELQNCSQLLRTFDESVKKFDASLSPAGSGNKVRDTIRKLQWNNVKAGIRELLGGLHQHIGAIQMLWQMHDRFVVLCRHLVLVCADSVFNCSHTLALINNQTEAIYAVVQRIEKKVILQSPGWHPDNEPIRFVDALERNINLPWECCRTWQVWYIRSPEQT